MLYSPQFSAVTRAGIEYIFVKVFLATIRDADLSSALRTDQATVEGFEGLAARVTQA